MAVGDILARWNTRPDWSGEVPAAGAVLLQRFEALVGTGATKTLPDGRVLFPPPGKSADYPAAAVRGFGWGFTAMWFIYAGVWTAKKVRRAERISGEKPVVETDSGGSEEKRP